MSEVAETLKMYRPWLAAISKAMEQKKRALSLNDIRALQGVGLLELPFIPYREGAFVFGVFENEELQDVMNFAVAQGIFQRERLSGRDFYRPSMV